MVTIWIKYYRMISEKTTICFEKLEKGKHLLNSKIPLFKVLIESLLKEHRWGCDTQCDVRFGKEGSDEEERMVPCVDVIESAP